MASRGQMGRKRRAKKEEEVKKTGNPLARRRARRKEGKEPEPKDSRMPLARRRAIRKGEEPKAATKPEAATEKPKAATKPEAATEKPKQAAPYAPRTVVKAKPKDAVEKKADKKPKKKTLRGKLKGVLGKLKIKPYTGKRRFDRSKKRVVRVK
jgi:hypothetical protein